MGKRKKKSSPPRPPEVETVEVRSVRLNEVIIFNGTTATVKEIHPRTFFDEAREAFGESATVFHLEWLSGRPLKRIQHIFVPSHSIRRMKDTTSKEERKEPSDA